MNLFFIFLFIFFLSPYLSLISTNLWLIQNIISIIRIKEQLIIHIILILHIYSDDSSNCFPVVISISLLFFYFLVSDADKFCYVEFYSEYVYVCVWFCFFFVCVEKMCSLFYSLELFSIFSCYSFFSYYFYLLHIYLYINTFYFSFFFLFFIFFVISGDTRISNTSYTDSYISKRAHQWSTNLQWCHTTHWHHHHTLNSIKFYLIVIRF